MSDLIWISGLSDDELFAQLKQKGISTPVTASTRNILEKKLARLLGLTAAGSSPASSEGLEDEYDDAEVTLDTSRNVQDKVRHRGRKGNDTLGNSFYMEEVDANPRDQLRNLRRAELDHLEEDLSQQAEINRSLGGLDKDGSQSSRTALTVLAVLVVIGIFLVISFMTQGESADELMRVPSVKVVPAERVVPANQL